MVSLAKFGRSGEVWGGLGDGWGMLRGNRGHGVAWGMLGNAPGSFGEVWGGLRKAWPMLGGCLGTPGEAWGGLRRVVTYTLGLSLG